ncbi:sensor histidine kinase [Rugosimonospora africana]|uniref:sensor histidine kinase n=1 Tax=Rugosimonospora africana TaxID=556532 RepID=UPI001943EC8F|nr:histidine kinase [Rugosimonospora africana]
MPHVLAWLGDHARAADWALAVLLAAFSVNQSPAGIVLSAALAATVVARRQHPAVAFAAAATLEAAKIALDLRPGITDLALMVLLYTLAANRPRRISVAGLAVSLLASAVTVVRPAAEYGSPLFATVIGVGGLAVTAWVLGDSMAYRRAYYAALEERAAQLEAERDAQARIATAAERARALQDSRARAVDESAARLRRIERDLHDGAQVRLTALAMTLGEIRECLDIADRDSDPVRMLVETAHQTAKDTLAELRDLARGIHPPVLDRGLDAALSALAETSSVPVVLQVNSAPERPSPAIEAITYFCAAELLANVAKHSAATRAAISVWAQDGQLVMTITDNGIGEAHLVPGGGLAGLLHRVQTVDGRLSIDSPAGGSTIITIELPWHA